MFKDPTDPEFALDELATLRSSPSFQSVAETAAHAEIADTLIRRTGTRGARVYDATIATICLERGAHELWTADRDFSRFPDLRTRNPLVD